MAQRRITFLRHATAVALTKGATHQQDLDRPLSPEGKEQPDERLTKLGKPKFDLATYSPAERAFETTLLMVDAASTTLLELAVLCYDGPGTPRGTWLAKLYTRLGVKHLGAYTAEDTEQYLYGQAKEALQDVLSYARQAKHTLVVTHMPLLPAIGMWAAHFVNSRWDKMLLEHVFKECEGFTLVYEDDRLVNIEFHIG